MRLRNLVSEEKKKFAKEMRRNPSPPERVLWPYLRKDRLGVRFGRQRIIRGYIADFWCPSRRLIVEVDGKTYHRPEWDEKRDVNLLRLGITTLRFDADFVLRDPETVARKVREWIRSRSYEFEGGKNKDGEDHKEPPESPSRWGKQL